MNKVQNDIILYLLSHFHCSQRDISNELKISLGLVNSEINNLIEMGYLNSKYELTSKSEDLLSMCVPKNAIILAAGFGTRMVPINLNTPKGLLEIKGESLVERLIKQLKSANIENIYIVVGFMKEKFEYLIDKYNVRLIVNPFYIEKNNLYSLYLARQYLYDCYIVPSDIYCLDNPFRKNELYSWYMISDERKDNTGFCYLKNGDVSIKNMDYQNNAIGISYIMESDSKIIVDKLESFVLDSLHVNDFWETILYDKNKLCIKGRLVNQNQFFEINTYEQLRELDSNSNQLKNDAIDIIMKTFNADKSEITSITSLKKGMTNRSFLFECNKKKYIMRIPGEGTEKLINRKEESDVYNIIKSKNICDNVLYINPRNGYKITEFINNSRVCDPFDDNDLKKCMKFLKKFHNLKMNVNHKFDIFKQINFYEKLWNGKKSDYVDYLETKDNVFSLMNFINNNVESECLTHIDAVPDNFLIFDDNGQETIRLIDWEYAGMQDPHVDIAMFCIYSLYDHKQIDHLIDIYFDDNCPLKTRIKIYCYIAACGLLWSNWCEYKKMLGVEFGEYSLAQYRYAKDYYKLAKSMMEGLDE